MSVDMPVITKTCPEASSKRSDVPLELKWDLSDLYKNSAEWEKDFDKAKDQLAILKDIKENYQITPENLYDTFEIINETESVVTNVHLYAFFNSDTHLNDQVWKERSGKTEELYGSYESLSSFVKLAILKMANEIANDDMNANNLVESIISCDQRLSEYRHYLKDVLKQRDHILKDQEWEANLQSERSEILFEAASAWKHLDATETPRSMVRFSDGTEFKANPDNYYKYRSVSNREDRKILFKTVFSDYKNYVERYASVFLKKVSIDNEIAIRRGYPNATVAEFDNAGIDYEAVQIMLQGVRKGLPTFHRFLKVYQKLLNLDSLEYHDSSAMPNGIKNPEFTIAEAVQMVSGALSPLGDDYLKMVKEAFENRWIDFCAHEGKVSYNYAYGSFDVHTYIMMNWNKRFQRISSIAHELGHAYHTKCSVAEHGALNSDYSKYVAEIPAIVNEVLLQYKVLNDPNKNHEEKVAIAMQILSRIRIMLFKQAIFFEFEQKIHEIERSGASMTSKILNSTYLDILRTYHGHNEGVINIDELYGVEWVDIPHFFKYRAYTLSYAMGMISAFAIASKIIEQDQDNVPGNGARDNLVKGMKLGSTAYPIDIIKTMGADLTNPETYESAFEYLDSIIDVIDQ